MSGLAYKKDALAIKTDKMIRVLRGGNIGEEQFLFKGDDVFISSELVKTELYLRKNYNTLNRLGVLSPMEYKRSLGMRYATPFKASAHASWSAVAVFRILKNPIYMLPLSKERALELLERDIPVYMLMEDNAEVMAFESEDIEMHTGMFGITRADWESVKDTVPAMDIAVIQERREQAFLNNPADSYAIFQLKSGEEQRLLRFENTDYERGWRRDGLHPGIYHDTCVQYGCPELCRCFCDSDDITYDGMHPKLLWHRTKTLGRGGDCCDFCLNILSQDDSTKTGEGQ